jgi:hypothetical protein
VTNDQPVSGHGPIFHEDIFIKVNGDRQYVTLQSIKVSGSGSVKGVTVEGSVESTTEYGWQYANKNGFTRIAPKDFLGFNAKVQTLTLNCSSNVFQPRYVHIQSLLHSPLY